MPRDGGIDKLQDDLDRPARCPRRGASPSDEPTLKTIAQATGRTAHVVTEQATPLFAQFRLGAGTVFEDFVGAGRRMGELLLLAIGGAPAEALHAIDAPRFAWPNQGALLLS